MKKLRFDTMKYDDVYKIYKENFINILPSDKFNAISTKYLEKYNELLKYQNKGYEPKSSMGRGWKYNWNMLWGWYFEEIIFEVFLLNKNILEVKYTGNDSAHNFIFNHEEKTTSIEGKKTTSPDYLITWKSGEQTYIETKTAVANVFSIKRGNVKRLYETMGSTGVYALIIMFDLLNCKYGAYNIKSFNDSHTFTNSSMEGQLCYELLPPKEDICNITTCNLTRLIDKDDFENDTVWKYKMLHEANEILSIKKASYPGLKKIITDKMSCEELEYELKYISESYARKLNDKKTKNPKIVQFTWEHIAELLKELKNKIG